MKRAAKFARSLADTMLGGAVLILIMSIMNVSPSWQAALALVGAGFVAFIVGLVLDHDLEGSER